MSVNRERRYFKKDGPANATVTVEHVASTRKLDHFIMICWLLWLTEFIATKSKDYHLDCT